MNKEDVKEGVYSGLIAGLIFLMLEMIMVPLFLGGSPWGPPRMIAAMVMGQGVLPPPASFDLGIVLVAMIVHFALSAIYGIILVAFIRNVTKGSALLIGAIFGLALYLINFYLFTEWLFPWFENARNWVSIVSHIVFGAAAGVIYKAFQEKYQEHCVAC